MTSKTGATIAITVVGLVLLTGSGLIQSSYADNGKVAAYQGGNKIDEENPGIPLMAVDCVGGLDADYEPVGMECQLYPPEDDKNSDSEGYSATDFTSTPVDCPDDKFGDDDVCFSITFDGSLFPSSFEGYHFHAIFYDENEEPICLQGSCGQETQFFVNNTFMVVPESPIGMAALVMSSLAALGGFMFLRGRKSNSMVSI